MTRRLVLLAWLAVSLFLSACATQQDLQTLQSDVNESRRVAFENRNQIRKMEDKVAVLEQQTQAATEKPGAQPDQEALTALRQSQAELGLRIEDLARELRTLQGRIEELQAGTDRSVSELNTQKDVIMVRLSALEERSRLIPAYPESTAKPPAPQTETPAAGSPAPPASPSSGNNRSIKPEEFGAVDLYKQGRDHFKAKEYVKARQSFQKLLDLYPNHEYAGNAQFWKGETYYAEKDYENAILAYEDVLRKYKQSEKSAGALLKQGFSFAELGDAKYARIILEAVKQKHPGTPEAELAAKKLESMGPAK